MLFRHVLRNALLPILTSTVAVLPLLFLGALIMESFFGIPGLGSYTIDAINAKATPAELDEARKRVEAAFTGDDLKTALEAIEARLQAISTT